MSASVKRGSWPRRSYATTIPIARSRTTSGTNSPALACTSRGSVWSTSGSSISESTRSLRRDESARLLAARRLDDESGAVGGRALDQHDARVEQLAQPSGRQLEQLRELRL